MNDYSLPDNPYLLLTPGPLSTSKTVKAAMLKDWCTWDQDYKNLVQEIRRRLVELATTAQGYTSVLMQGSGTFSVESVIGSAVGDTGKLLVLINGVYGMRIFKIAKRYRMNVVCHDSGETGIADLRRLDQTLATDSAITHVAVVHCETTTGMLNPVDEIGGIVKRHKRCYIVDAMSSFGGIPMDVDHIGADFLISSANKCLQGVPGFGFIIARKEALTETRGRSVSLSLDLFDQWEEMERGLGKWRFTSPTHVVRAFHQALVELEEEGGVEKRHQRYRLNQRLLVDGMRKLGFTCLLPDHCQSPIITAFHSPGDRSYRFETFYELLKSKGFVIYPGKVTEHDTFRIGNIGHVFAEDIGRLLSAVEASLFWI
jgi:2-aminoethylphosphonate-pyruvate transaminase